MKVRVALVAGLFAIGSYANATVIQVFSRGALGGNSTFDWAQIGPDGSVEPASWNANSSLGPSATISDTGFQRLTEGVGWSGMFTAGDPVLFGFGPSFTASFASPVAGVGLDIHSNLFGDFIAQLEVYDSLSTLLGTFFVNGTNNGGSTANAPFLGALSDQFDIASAVFTITQNGGEGLGVDQMDVVAVPEPASSLLLGAGIAALALLRRHRR